ncbi:MAG: 16S rRNA (uracil(1498)-N(3))-methyltransferase [Mariprofundaceae bacterium]
MNQPRNPHCRIFTETDLSHALGQHAKVVLDAEQAHYLRSVMRLATGAKITLFDGNGGEYDGEITRLDKNEACCTLATYHDVDREMTCRVHIIQAACRSEKIEHVLQKSTELGAAGFSIVRSERSTLKLSGQKLNTRLKRWRKIIGEAAEQSGRTHLPDVHWCESLNDIPATELAFVLHPEAATAWNTLRDKLREKIQSANAKPSISLAIGPEGGFSERDLQTLTANGFHPLCFGPRVMRTETAAPALLAAIAAIS